MPDAPAYTQLPEYLQPYQDGVVVDALKADSFESERRRVVPITAEQLAADQQELGRIINIFSSVDEWFLNFSPTEAAAEVREAEKAVAEWKRDHPKLASWSDQQGSSGGIFKAGLAALFSLNYYADLKASNQGLQRLQQRSRELLDNPLIAAMVDRGMTLAEVQGQIYRRKYRLGIEQRAVRVFAASNDERLGPMRASIDQVPVGDPQMQQNHRFVEALLRLERNELLTSAEIATAITASDKSSMTQVGREVRVVRVKPRDLSVILEVEPPALQRDLASIDKAVESSAPALQELVVATRGTTETRKTNALQLLALAGHLGSTLPQAEVIEGTGGYKWVARAGELYAITPEGATQSLRQSQGVSRSSDAALNALATDAVKLIDVAVQAVDKEAQKLQETRALIELNGLNQVEPAEIQHGIDL